MGLIAASTHPFGRLARAAQHRPRPLPQPDRGLPGARPPARDLRHARPCRDRGRRAAHRPDEPALLLPAAPPGAVTSSPFWQGQDTGLKSFRLTMFGNLPRTGLPSLRELQRVAAPAGEDERDRAVRRRRPRSGGTSAPRPSTRRWSMRITTSARGSRTRSPSPPSTRRSWRACGGCGPQPDLAPLPARS